MFSICLFGWGRPCDSGHGGQPLSVHFIVDVIHELGWQFFQNVMYIYIYIYILETRFVNTHCHL